jgi:hypothetical protein
LLFAPGFSDSGFVDEMDSRSPLSIGNCGGYSIFMRTTA